MSPNYRYYLTIDGSEFEAFPGGEWKLEIKSAEEDFSFCKDYRIKFAGDLIFTGNDYDQIIAEDCCDKIDFKVTCDGKDYWLGYFANPYDFEIDEDACTIKGTPKPLDKYYYFDFYADEEYTNLGRNSTFTYQNNYPTAPPGDTWSVCLPCETLWDIVTAIGTGLPLEPTGFTYTVISTFFQNHLFPDGTNPYPVDNYVTGYRNNLNDIVVAMAEDVCSLDTVAANLQDMPEWSWNDLMELLHNVFNTWWYIDEAGDIRIEHIYFWELYFGTAYDLTTIEGGKWIVNSSKYSFLTSDIPSEEHWDFNRVTQVGPQGSAITYDCNAPGIVNFIKEYDLNKLTYDLEYVAPGTNNFATSPVCANIDDDCYIFIRCVPYAWAVGQGYTPTVCTYCAWDDLVIRAAPLPPVLHVNGHLYPFNLLANYWMHDRPLWEGDMPNINRTGITFESVQKNLKQTKISFPVCCDAEAELILTGNVGTNPRYLYDFPIIEGTILTQFGDGDVYAGDIENGMFSGELIFEDLCDHGEPYEWSNASDI